jgi:hypothetical protein
MGRAGQVLPPAPLEVQGEPLEKQLPASDGAGSLSEKLERSKGVITPPASGTDPGIVKSAPDTGETKMPAIPPPGTPGAIRMFGHNDRLSDRAGERYSSRTKVIFRLT